MNTVVDSERLLPSILMVQGKVERYGYMPTGTFRDRCSRPLNSRSRPLNLAVTRWTLSVGR